MSDSGVHADEAARQILEVRAGETPTDPTDIEMRGHCEAVVAARPQWAGYPVVR